MSDVKFSCPSCGQHLSVDSSCAGRSVPCPTCGTQITVPGVQRAMPLSPPPLGKVPPTPPPVPAQTPGQAVRTCGLAVASLICSVGSFLIIPLGFIPGIICGHMARKKIANERLGGAGFARAGLIVGYISLGLHVIALVVAIAFVTTFAGKFAKMAEDQRRPGFIPKASRMNRSRDLPPAQPTPVEMAPSDQQPADTTPDSAGWTLKLDEVEIPSGKISGRIRGQRFSADKVQLEHGWLKFRQGSDFFADLQMDVVPFVKGAQELNGRTFLIQARSSGMNPHIWMHWKNPGTSAPQQKAFMNGYAMRLEFGQMSNGKLPGKIYLCVPDPEKSFVRGNFEAIVTE